MATEAQGGIIQNGMSGSYSYVVKAGQENMPVVFVSFWDAARFANWLHNGQPTGSQIAATTEDGAYTLNGYTGSDGSSILRHPDAKWFLPTANEWYKAAYHKNSGPTADYWAYPTKSDVRPNSDQPPGSDAPDPSNTANIWRDDGMVNGYDDGYAVSGSPSSDIHTELLLTQRGAYSFASSPYGTFDQGGNATEWNETISASTYRGMRGGSYSDGFSDYVVSSQSADALPSDENHSAFGFRVATVPEPSTVAMIGLAYAAISAVARPQQSRIAKKPSATA
jgi:formylglycine-generating enzyme required for sulfatase activity